MRRKLSPGQPSPRRTQLGRIDRSLQITLWTAWTLAVATTAYMTWHAANMAHRPLSRLTLIIHCTLVGLIGLVVITVVEIRLTDLR